MTVFTSPYLIPDNWKNPKAWILLPHKHLTFFTITPDFPGLHHSVILWFFLDFSCVFRIFFSSSKQTLFTSNTTTVELQGAKIISNGFDLDMLRIINKLLLAGFPKTFMNDTITYFIFVKLDVIIPDWLTNELWLFIFQKLILKMINANSL